MRIVNPSVPAESHSLTAASTRRAHSRADHFRFSRETENGVIFAWWREMDSNQRYGFPYCLARSQRLPALTFSVKSGQRFGKFVQGRRSLMAHWRKSWDKAQLPGRSGRNRAMEFHRGRRHRIEHVPRARSRGGGHIRGVRRRALEAFGGTASPKRDTLDASAAAGERRARDLRPCCVPERPFTSRRSSAAAKLGRRRGEAVLSTASSVRCRGATAHPGTSRWSRSSRTLS